MDKKSSLRIKSEFQSAGITTTINNTFADVNSSLSDADFVSVGNAFGNLLRYAPTQFDRIDVLSFSPDEFDSVVGGSNHV